MSDEKIVTRHHTANEEEGNRSRLFKLFQEAPIPKGEMLNNLGLFIKRHELSRIIYIHELYQLVLGKPGVIMDFGTRWGQNMALFSSFRGMYEPYNYYRKIIGFDSFEGFVDIHAKDGSAEIAKKGNYSTSKNYEAHLESILNCHEAESPISHIKKYELRKGNAIDEIEKYLGEHPETIIAFAYFDFDLYEPTKCCLKSILPHLTKGAVLAFDQLNCSVFPGETIAFKEILGTGKFSLRCSANNPGRSYLIFD